MVGRLTDDDQLLQTAATITDNRLHFPQDR